MFGKVQNKLAGTTLIEAMTVLFIFSIISVTFYSVWSTGLKFIMESKNKMGATALLNEKMEIIRNLPYASIGVSGGAPSGNIPQTASVTVNAHTYTVETHIDYKDDAFDGTYPADTIPNDYKLVRVEISWPGPTGGTSSIVGVARFVPPGLEVADPNTGVLSINIMGTDGVGVAQSTVRIRNSTVSPAIDMTRDTDNFGNIMIPGFKQSIGEYHLTVSKNNYETIDTISLTDSAAIPIDNYTDNHAGVVLGGLSTKTIIQDKTADLKMRSEDYLGIAIPSVAYHIVGGRRLGTNIGVDVYNLNQNDTTTAAGEKAYASNSPGGYFLSNIGAVAGYTFFGIKSNLVFSYDNATQIYNFSLLPAADETVKLLFAKNNVDSLLVYVLDNTLSAPINGATVKVTNASSYDVSQDTKSDGVVFFPTTADAFVAGNYNIEVSAPGYQSKTESAVTVSQLTSKEIKLDLN